MYLASWTACKRPDDWTIRHLVQLCEIVDDERVVHYYYVNPATGAAYSQTIGDDGQTHKWYITSNTMRED